MKTKLQNTMIVDSIHSQWRTAMARLTVLGIAYGSGASLRESEDGWAYKVYVPYWMYLMIDYKD